PPQVGGVGRASCFGCLRAILIWHCFGGGAKLLRARRPIHLGVRRTTSRRGAILIWHCFGRDPIAVCRDVVGGAEDSNRATRTRPGIIVRTRERDRRPPGIDEVLARQVASLQKLVVSRRAPIVIDLELCEPAFDLARS